MREARVQPSAHTYKLLIDAYGTLPPIDLVSVERIHAEMLADPEVAPQATHLASLITAYGMYGNDMAKALEVFESNHGQPEDSAKDAIVWESILNVVAHHGTLADLEAMRQRMQVSGVRPTAYVYNVLITGYARGGELDKARETFESMGDSVSGVAAPNNHPILHTSSGYLKPSTATEAPTNTIYREPSTYEAMIRAELGAGETQRARDLLNRMEARGYPFAVFMKVKALVDEPSMPSVSPTPCRIIRPSGEVKALKLTMQSLGHQSVFAPSNFADTRQDLGYTSSEIQENQQSSQVRNEQLQ